MRRTRVRRKHLQFSTAFILVLAVVLVIAAIAQSVQKRQDRADRPHRGGTAHRPGRRQHLQCDPVRRDHGAVEAGLRPCNGPVLDPTFPGDAQKPSSSIETSSGASCNSTPTSRSRGWSGPRRSLTVCSVGGPAYCVEADAASGDDVIRLEGVALSLLGMAMSSTNGSTGLDVGDGHGRELLEPKPWGAGRRSSRPINTDCDGSSATNRRQLMHRRIHLLDAESQASTVAERNERTHG